MQDAQYRFKFYLNASHAIYLGGEMGQSHPHTWEVTLNTMKVTESFVLFGEVEKMCEAFFSTYKDMFINTVPPFTTINPTLENLCHYFRDKLQEMLYEKGWLLLSIELSETPSRSYIISITDEMEMRKKISEGKQEVVLLHLVERMADKKLKAISEHKTLKESNMVEAVSEKPQSPVKKKPIPSKKKKKKKTIWSFLWPKKTKPVKKGTASSKTSSPQKKKEELLLGEQKKKKGKKK